MEKDSGETVKKKESKVANSGLQIIKHPSYNSFGKALLAWFDIRVFYVRISSFMVDGYTPEYLTLNHIPLHPETVLEVNGRRCTEGSLCRLRRNQVDRRFEEATFVSTDSIRLSGSVRFEVFDGEDLVLSGVLEMNDRSNGFVGESKGDRWSMSCESMVGTGVGFLKGKQNVGPDLAVPMVEVYVAGSFSGTPIVLTKTLQRKKHNRNRMLDPIPESEATESQRQDAPRFDLQVAEYRRDKPANEDDYDSSLYWGRTEYLEGEDGELSWFNAGVRVGVGIGLGICLGVGIGVGLLVRTYQSTTRNFRRRL